MARISRGYNIGVWVTVSATGSDPNCLFQGLSLDANQPGVQIDTGDPEAGLQFTNFFLTGETAAPQTNPNGAAIVITSTFGTNPPSHVRFTNGVIWGISP